MKFKARWRTDLRVHWAAIADLGAAAGALRARAVRIGRGPIELGLELDSVGWEHAGHGDGRSGGAGASGQLRRRAGRGVVLLLQLLPTHLPALCQRHIPAHTPSAYEHHARI